jgi:hypothetical protein
MEEITYLLCTPSGNCIRIGLDISFRSGFIQRVPQNSLDFFVGNLPVVFLKIPWINKRPRQPRALETALAGWSGIE